MPLPVVPAILIGYFLSRIVFRVLALLGIGIISYVGIDPLIDEAIALVDSTFTSMPPLVLQTMGILNIDKYVSLIFSAYSIRLTIVLVKFIGLR